MKLCNAKLRLRIGRSMTSFLLYLLVLVSCLLSLIIID